MKGESGVKRYVFGRLLRSLISLFLVTTITYVMIFSLVPKKTVFSNDPAYSKMASKPDARIDYENTIYRRMGYVDYLDSKSLQKKAAKFDESVTVFGTKKNKEVYQKWAAKEYGNWKIKQFQISNNFYAIRDISLVERVWRFYSKLIQVDHPWRIKNSDNPDLKRGYRFSNDSVGGVALIGSGTKYKYQIYFDGHFPFIHQNMIKIYLGESYPTFSGRGVMDVISSGQGETQMSEVTFPKGGKQVSPVNIHTAQYQPLKNMDSMTRSKFGNDPYSKTENFYKDPSMMNISLRMGIISIIFIYVLGIPMAILMARYKSQWIDGLCTGLITLLISIPSLAIIYFLRFIGSSFFGLPDLFPVLGARSVVSYVMPTLILGALGISIVVIWARRYLIDQRSSDYVKFARAKGLSEMEISRNHVLKNAMIPIVQGIPLAIILTFQGATMTETIFATPGMGKMLPDSIIFHNNSIVVGLVFIFTLLAVLAVFVGDLLMTFIDPRIKLDTKGGK